MSQDARWDEARELFLDLADLPDDARRRELEALRARDGELADWVERLLRHDRGATDGPSGAPSAPRRFGPYEEVRLVGRGGMGEVFVARRADGEYEREVAVKLLPAGAANDELVRRFLRERQTLARLDHEYITRLVDGGTTEDGRPYLVMEYVDGEPADVAAARLPLEERLRLFVRIGRAVAHAHAHGVVHRDLKPGNILVRADGTPRLLDFGIAAPDPTTRADDDGAPLTRTGHRLFTPEYASPEQVRGEPATPASDVFALGVLLHVFLCGVGPWDADGLHALERRILEDDPVPPSRRATGAERRRLAGDLDAIVLQCLEKRPERRYRSVDALCEDVAAHLDGRPIRARRTGAMGRAVRFARRQPAYPVVVALLLVAALAAYAAHDSGRRAEQHEVELADTVRDRLAAARDHWADGDAEAAFAEMDAATAALDGLPEDPALEAEVLAQGAVFAHFGDRPYDALALVDEAAARLGLVDAPDPQVLAKLLNVRAAVRQEIDTGARSREEARVALAYATANLEPGHVLRVDALVGWTKELRRLGETEDALRFLEQAVDETRRREPRGEILSRLLNQYAVACSESGRYAPAADAYREAIGILAWNHGERHPATAKVRLNLGSTLFRMGRLDEARDEYERSLVVNRELGEDLLVAGNLHFLGRIHAAQGRLEAAEEAAREALALREKHDLGMHAERSRCLLGIVHAKAGRAAEARALLEPLLVDAPPDRFLPDMEAEARHLLGALLHDVGDHAARQHLERALELERALYGPEHPGCRELEALLASPR